MVKKKCAVCGEIFTRENFLEYAWKLLVKKNITHYYCSYTCFRVEEKQKLAPKAKKKALRTRPVSLLNLATNELLPFDSMSLASEYLERNPCYVRDRIRKKAEIVLDFYEKDKYKIIV